MHAPAGERRPRLGGGAPHLSAAARHPAGEPQAVAAQDAQPRRQVGLERAAAQRARGHADHLAIALQAEQRVAFGEGEQRALHRRAVAARAPHRVQRLGMAAEGERPAGPRPMRVAPATQSGGRGGPGVLHRFLLLIVVSGDARGADDKRAGRGAVRRRVTVPEVSQSRTARAAPSPRSIQAYTPAFSTITATPSALLRARGEPGRIDDRQQVVLEEVARGSPLLRPAAGTSSRAA